MIYHCLCLNVTNLFMDMNSSPTLLGICINSSDCKASSMFFGIKIFLCVFWILKRNHISFDFWLWLQISAKDQQKFQSSYATVLKAHMHALKKRERKDKKKAAEVNKKEEKAPKKSRSSTKVTA